MKFTVAYDRQFGLNIRLSQFLHYAVHTGILFISWWHYL